jgi:hypothetical protein
MINPPAVKPLAAKDPLCNVIVSSVPAGFTLLVVVTDSVFPRKSTKTTVGLLDDTKMATFDVIVMVSPTVLIPVPRLMVRPTAVGVLPASKLGEYEPRIKLT